MIPAEWLNVTPSGSIFSSLQFTKVWPEILVMLPKSVPTAGGGAILAAEYVLGRGLDAARRGAGVGRRKLPVECRFHPDPRG